MSSTTLHRGRFSRLAHTSAGVGARNAAYAWIVLVLGMLATGAALLYLTRRTTFWVDEWVWIDGRRATNLATFLDPHNSHLSLVPIAIYKLLFATVGISHYLPYRLMVTVGHLLVVALLFVYVKRRVGPFLALLAAALISLFGPGWQEFLWPFQIAWLIAIATGIGALLMLDRGDRFGDLIAALLISVSLASTSVGVAIALGIAVEIAVARRRRRDAWIVGVPLALYALWTLVYQHAQFAGDVSSTVGFVAQSAVAAIPALLGLSGTNALDSSGTLLAFGVPLTVAAVMVLVWVGARRPLWSVRALTLISILLAFWILTGVGRSDLGGPFATRYVYVDAVICVLLASEFARGVVPGRRIQLGLALVTAAALVSNIGVLRNGAGYLRAQAEDANADLGAVNADGASAPKASYVSTVFPGYPFVLVRPADLLAAERALGRVGDNAAQLASAPEHARNVADAETVELRALGMRASLRSPALGSAPTIDSTSGGIARRSGSCVSFQATVAGPGGVNELAVTLPRGGAWLYPPQDPATVGIRRFASEFRPLGSVAVGTGALLLIPADTVDAPWHLQVMSAGRVNVCGLAG